MNAGCQRLVVIHVSSAVMEDHCSENRTDQENVLIMRRGRSITVIIVLAHVGISQAHQHGKTGGLPGNTNTVGHLAQQFWHMSAPLTKCFFRQQCAGRFSSNEKSRVTTQTGGSL